MASELLCSRSQMTTAFAPLAADLFPVPSRLGPYQVVGLIAEGGMGIVLRGQDLRDGRQVALKTVRSPRGGDAVSIRREIAALGRMSHPGIVRLVEDGASDGVPWMALELLRGRTVCEEIERLWGSVSAGTADASPRSRCYDDVPTVREGRHAEGGRSCASIPRAKPLPAAGCLRDAVAIVAQLCHALDYVHTLGLVHRDVKPANVFLRDDGRVTLLDFGLICPARGAAAAFTSAEICVGTMEYAAPEQIRGEPVDARADIYSLGCVLYELVTGRRPADAESSLTVVERQHWRVPAPASELVSYVPGELEDLLLAALERRPDDRPQSAGEVAETLTQLVDRLDWHQIAV
jgi:serine/threonine protein kinase